MIKLLLRYTLGVVFLIALLAPATGQDREFYQKPQTNEEFWRYMNHEIELGNYKLAAGYLKTFIARTPSDEELLKLYDQDGSSAFQRLLTIPQTREEAKPLVERVDALVQKFLSDRKRLDTLIKSLSGDAEERAYAIGQLRRSGALAVPALVDALLRTANEPDEHTSILTALPRLDQTTVPPLLAALDADDPVLKVELIGVLRRRTEIGAAPYLWYLSASPRQPPSVRKAATAALSAFLGLTPDKLPAARLALTQQAERYYRHQVPFPAPTAVTVWRWDGQHLTSQVVTATQAEEYYGLRFARQALDLEPGYAPAQVVFLSTALDKAMERVGLDPPLSRGALPVKELLTSVNPQLVAAVLDKALQERRLTVILGAARALGELAAVNAARPRFEGPPVLVRALNYPDRRVQMAAAEALLRIPTTNAPSAGTRVVDVLRRMLGTETPATVLVADADRDRAALVGKALEQAGYRAVVVNSGREALARLRQAADVDALLVDAGIVNPLLPDVVASLRANVDDRGLPLFVTADPEAVQKVTRQFDRYRNLWVLARTTSAPALKQLLAARIAETSGRPLSDAERKDYAARAIEWLARVARGEVPGYDARPAAPEILKALRSKDLAVLAVEAAGRLPGREPQRELATVVLNTGLPEGLRSAAAIELTRHIQAHGLVLTPDQVKGLQALFDALADSNLKANVALVMGSLRPDARQSGERLQRYVPGLAAPAAAPPAKGKKPAPREEDTDKNP